jgi:hypothetical protein
VADEEEDVVPEPPVPTQSLSQARRSRRQSTQASTAESAEPAIQAGPASVAASGTRRSSRTSAPPRDLPGRRLRSASREVPEKTPPPPSRSTRSVSRSRTSMSPSVGLQSPAPATPRTRRVSRSLQSDTDGPGQETPKQVGHLLPLSHPAQVLKLNNRPLAGRPAEVNPPKLRPMPSTPPYPLSKKPTRPNRKHTHPPWTPKHNLLPSDDRAALPPVHYL